VKDISHPEVVVVCCGVLQTEVESLVQAHWPEQKLKFLPSMMHMHPEQLGSSLQPLLDDELKMGRRVVLIYGDCCPRMATLEAVPGVARTRGKNCCELLLGPEEYRRLSHEGTFFLIPEWARRWKEVFAKELGLNRANAAGLMQEMHNKLVYLDTGLAPVPEGTLAECAEYCGLPYEVRPVSLDLLHTAIEDALLRSKLTGHQDET
jgi:hypothetical protein